MGTGINKLRYAYYCSHHFYFFLAGCLGVGMAAIAMGLHRGGVLDVLPWDLVLAALGGIGLSLLGLKTFLCMARRPFILAGLYGGGVSLLVAGGLAELVDATAGLQPLGAFLFAIGVAAIFIPRVLCQRIKIYPNRVRIGRLLLYYKDMVSVRWGAGQLVRQVKDLPPAQQQKPVTPLTPLLYASGGKDFSITHYYILVEMPAQTYVAQPVFWRNSLAQNLRNGWLETWRWDGSTVPPAGWVRPD